MEGFVAYDFSKGLPSLSVTPNGVLFGKNVVKCLDYPKNIYVLINEKEKKIAVEATNDVNKYTHQFFNKESTILAVRINGKAFLKEIERVSGIKDKPYRVYGEHIKENGRDYVVFDLKTAIEMV